MTVTQPDNGTYATTVMNLYITTNYTASFSDLQPPYFTPALTTQSYTVGNPILKITLHPYDSNPTDVITVSLFGSYSFVSSLVGSILSIYSTSAADVGAHTITLQLSDGSYIPQFSFILTIIPATNTPPSFITTSLTEQVVYQGQTFLFNLPAVVDPDTGDLAKIIVTVL